MPPVKSQLTVLFNIISSNPSSINTIAHAIPDTNQTMVQAMDRWFGNQLKQGHTITNVLYILEW